MNSSQNDPNENHAFRSCVMETMQGREESERTGMLLATFVRVSAAVSGEA